MTIVPLPPPADKASNADEGVSLAPAMAAGNTSPLKMSETASELCDALAAAASVELPAPQSAPSEPKEPSVKLRKLEESARGAKALKQATLPFGLLTTEG